MKFCPSFFHQSKNWRKSFKYSKKLDVFEFFWPDETCLSWRGLKILIELFLFTYFIHNLSITITPEAGQCCLLGKSQQWIFILSSKTLLTEIVMLLKTLLRVIPTIVINWLSLRSHCLVVIFLNSTTASVVAETDFAHRRISGPQVECTPAMGRACSALA